MYGSSASFSVIEITNEETLSIFETAAFSAVVGAAARGAVVDW
jgi:hypothetical protein